jgi:hypothetical protein
MDTASLIEEFERCRDLRHFLRNYVNTKDENGDRPLTEEEIQFIIDQQESLQVTYDPETTDHTHDQG